MQWPRSGDHGEKLLGTSVAPVSEYVCIFLVLEAHYDLKINEILYQRITNRKKYSMFENEVYEKNMTHTETGFFWKLPRASDGVPLLHTDSNHT